MHRRSAFPCAKRTLRKETALHGQHSRSKPKKAHNCVDF